MKANEALNAIKAFSIQASKTTRAFVNDGITVGKGMVKDGALARQMAIKAGIGAGVGAVAGAGFSSARDDGRMGRDSALGGVAGALLGAGWAGRKAGPTAWKARGFKAAASGFTETNAAHGPSQVFERAEQSGGLRNGWEKAEFAAGESRESRLDASINSMSGSGSPRVRAGNIDRGSSYGYSALPNRYKLPRDR